MKTITIGTMQLELTPERRRRVIDALKETQHKLAKELTYSDDLQDTATIEFYRKHIEKLMRYLLPDQDTPPAE